MRFVSVVNDGDADANGWWATCLPSGMARIREESHGTVGWGLRRIAEELAQRILLVLA